MANMTPEQFRRLSSKRQSEKLFQQMVIDLATIFGWTHYHTLDSRGSDPDFPDCVFRRGAGVDARIIVAELKKEGEEPTPGQIAWLDAFAAAGVLARLWRPSDWPDIVRAFQSP